MLKWRGDFELGIENLDRQHRELFELVNRAYGVLRDISSKDRHGSIAPILEELLEHAKYHFESEESYMLKVKYRGYFKHKVEHTRLIRELNIKLLEFNSLYTGDIDRILNYISRWIVDHIVEEDLKLVEKNQVINA